MTHRRPIPLIHRAELEPFQKFLAGIGAPLDAAMEAARLPRPGAAPGAAFVAARSAIGFVGICARTQGVPDLGWRVLEEVPLERTGCWGPAVARSATLWDAIHTLCRLYPREVSFVELGLSREPEYAWLWRRRTPAATVKGWVGDAQGEQFMLRALIQVVRLAAGPGWIPPRVRLESPGSDWILRAESLGDVRVEFGGPVMAIAVPYALLRSRIRQPGTRRARHAAVEREPGLPTPASDFVGTLQQALEPLVGEGELSIELGAEIARTSPRTLSRWLASEGTSWRRLVDRVRLDAADRMLADPALPLGEIAAELGYSDHAHFTRAFRRWTGESPSAYRLATCADAPDSSAGAPQSAT